MDYRLLCKLSRIESVNETLRALNPGAMPTLGKRGHVPAGRFSARSDAFHLIRAVPSNPWFDSSSFLTTDYSDFTDGPHWGEAFTATRPFFYFREMLAEVE